MTPEEYQQQFDILEAATKDTHARLWHEAPVAEQRVICPLCHAERAHGYCLCAAQRKPGEGGFTWDRNNPSGPTEKFLQNHAQWPHTLCRDETCKFCTSKVGDVCECCEEEGDGGGDDLEVASPVPLVIPDKVWVDGTIVPSDDASPAAAQWPELPLAERIVNKMHDSRCPVCARDWTEGCAMCSERLQRSSAEHGPHDQVPSSIKWPEPPFAVHENDDRFGPRVIWVVALNDRGCYAIIPNWTGQTLDLYPNVKYLTLYTPQPGDMIPLWPYIITTKSGQHIESQELYADHGPHAFSVFGPIDVDDAHVRLALEQPPHWVRKE